STENLSSGCASAADAQRFFCLPNPSYWALAARAYAQLLMENPQYFNKSRQDELQRIVADGNTIAGAMARLSANDAGPDDQGTPSGTGNRLLDAAVAYYRYWGGASFHPFGSTPSLPDVLRAEEQNYLSSQNVAAINPWGGLKQQPDFATLETTPSFTNIPLCPAFVQTLAGNIDPNSFMLP